jgi:tRNA G26 N,N-dimethylase Trm1
MAFDERFLRLMPLTVTVQSSVAAQYDLYGQPVMSATTKTYRARVQHKKVRFTNTAGDTITSTMQLYMACTDKLSNEDKVTIPGIDLTGKPIQGVEPVDDYEGPHHTVVYF